MIPLTIILIYVIKKMTINPVAQKEKMNNVYKSADRNLVKNSFNPCRLILHGNQSVEYMVARERYTNEYMLKSRTRLLQKYLNGKQKILDCGCSNGFVSKKILEKLKNKNIKLYGVDISDYIIKIAKENFLKLKFKAKFMTSNLEKLPFKDDFFDLIYCFSTLAHVENIGKCIDEMYRVLKPEGILIISTHKKAIDFFIFPTIIAKVYNLLNKPVKRENTEFSEYTELIIMKPTSVVRKSINKSVNKLNLNEIERVPYLYYIDPFWERFLGKKICMFFKLGNFIQKLPISYYKNLEYLVYQKQ